MSKIKQALLEAANWKEYMTIQESKLQIAYFELREIVINRIMDKYDLK